MGQLTALILAPDEDLYMDSEDLQSAFNLFRVPANWSPYFAYSRKVHGSAFGRPDLEQVRPALCVIPMGWKSGVTKELARTEGTPSKHHIKFNEVNDSLGLPRNAAKQLVGAASGGIQGGDLDGVAGVIQVGRDKLENFLAISLALLCLPTVSEFQVRHWIGKRGLRGHLQTAAVFDTAGDLCVPGEMYRAQPAADAPGD